MKVLVSDVLGESGIQMFKDADGIEVDVKTGMSPDELKSVIGEYDGLVIRSATKVTEDVLEAATNLKVVGRAGIGLDNVDIPAATKRGVIVMNTPGGNVVTTAEHAIAMMLSLTRNIPLGTMTLKQGKWEKKKLQGREIFNKTLGLIGFGKIGSIVADRAKGLKMKVVIYDPFITPEKIEEAGYIPVTLDELYARADYISIHVPKLKETQNLLNKEAFGKMKDGVMVVNCARGGIVNEADLMDAMDSGKVAGAALDVFETEPAGDIPLMTQERFICTPHLGASTKEAQTNVAVAVADQLIECLINGTIINAVNAPSVTGDLLTLLRPFLTLGENIGSLQAQLVQGPVKKLQIEFHGDFMGLDLSSVSTGIIKGFLSPKVKDEVNFVNAAVIAKDMGIKVTESTSTDAEDFVNLITVNVISDNETSSVSGTIYGKKEARVVMINKFRLELVPEGNLLFIHNTDKPGAIGSIGTVLGNNGVNIGRMHVGQEDEDNRNVIFITTDAKASDEVVEELRQLSMVNTVMPIDL